MRGATALLSLISATQLKVHRAPGFLHQEVASKTTTPCFKRIHSFQGDLLGSITACWRKQWEPVTQPSVFMGWQDLLSGIMTFLLSTFLIKLFDYKIKLGFCKVISSIAKYFLTLLTFFPNKEWNTERFIDFYKTT